MVVKATSSVTLMMVSDGAKGSDGKGISTIIHHYLVTNVTTGVTTNTTGWKTSPSSVTTTNKYLWYYQTINYTTGSPTNTTPAIIGVYGDTGGKGETGKGIKSVTPEYYLSTSNTTQTGGSWKTTQDAWISGKYYWTRDSINWNDGSTTTTTPTLATGLNNANSTANNAQTIANQTATKFQWIVKSGSSATDFTLTDRTAQLVADNINLNGLVTFKGLDSSTQNKITEANSKIDKLQKDKADQSIIDNWAKDAVVNGETVINGGYIKSQTIKTDQLAVNDIFATGSAVMNIINAQEINANRITSGLLNAERINAYGLNIVDKTTNQQTFNVSPQGEVTMRGSVSSYNYTSGKTGWTINNDGTAEFNDIIARGSVITNDGGIVSSGGSGRNLQLNTSFYNGLTSWSRGDKYSVDTGFQYKLTNTVKFERSELTADSVQYLYSGWNKIPCTVDKSYTAQANFYTKDSGAIDGSGVILGIYFYTSDNNSVGTFRKKVSFTNNQWVYESITAVAPQNATYVSIVIGAYRNGKFWVAQPKIEEGNIATPWCLNPSDKVKQVRFWAGSSYEERESAPWVVYSDGSMKATQGEFSGVFSGTVDIGNIKIADPSATAGGDALVTIQNGQSGIKKVQLTDTESSKFAQDIVITNNTYSNMVLLKQDGTGIFNAGINVANTVMLTSSGMTINNKLFSASSSGFVANANLDVGSVSYGANLVVHGNTTTENAVINKTLYFGSVLSFTTMSNGLDIDYIDS